MRTLRFLSLAATVAVLSAAAGASRADTVPLCSLPQRERVTAEKRAPRAARSVVVVEAEPNDSPATANPITLGTGGGRDAAIDVAGSLSLPVPRAITADEDDGAITIATSTGLEIDQVIVAEATLGDGPYGASSGDFDFYQMTAAAGDRIRVEVRAQRIGSPLDSYLGIYSSNGELLASNDDAAGTGSTDSALTLVAPEDDSYFVAVRGFGTGFPHDPFDSSSGYGAGSVGFYEVEIELGSAVVDYFRFDLEAGDVLGAAVSGAATRLALRGADGTPIVESGQNVTPIYPSVSPLPAAGAAAFAWVASEAGTCTLAVSGGAGSYTLQLRTLRPALESQARGSRQILFLDFDGASVDVGRFGGVGVRTLSPLSSFLSRWGLPATAEDEVIDAIVARVAKNFATVGETGANGDFFASGVDGEFAVEIRNSRDDPSAWGQPNATRIVVGGTIAELGIRTIGIAESVDVGNFAQAETAVVLLDNLSDPNPSNQSSLSSFGIEESRSLTELIGTAVGNAVSHEAGHLFGSFHTDRFDAVLCLMDVGGDLADVIGVGEDRIFGSADDVDVAFTTDDYAVSEGFSGIEDTLNVNAFGLSTGKGAAVATPTATATATATATLNPSISPPPSPTRTATPTRTPVTPTATPTPTEIPTAPPPGICAGVPRTDCRQPRQSSLALRAAAGRPERNRITWKWAYGKGELADLGNPLEATGYDLCVYDAGGLRASVSLPPAPSCGPDRGCWQQLGDGFVYRDGEGRKQGLRQLSLRSSDGLVRIKLKGDGAEMPLPALPLYVPVTLQLVSSEGRCWTAAYSQLKGNNLDRVTGRSPDR